MYSTKCIVQILQKKFVDKNDKLGNMRPVLNKNLQPKEIYGKLY